MVSVLPAPPPVNVSEALPKGCILSADAMALMGVKRARFSQYKGMGLVTPHGKVRTGGGQWADYYLRSEIVAAAKRMEQEAKAKAEAVIVKPAANLKPSTSKPAANATKPAPAPSPTPKDLYPETSMDQHKASAMEEVRRAMQLGKPFGLIVHATSQMWRTAPLGQLEPGWGFVLRLERSDEGWLGTVPISCRGNWTGKIAADILETLRQSKAVKG